MKNKDATKTTFYLLIYVPRRTSEHNNNYPRSKKYRPLTIKKYPARSHYENFKTMFQDFLEERGSQFCAILMYACNAGRKTYIENVRFRHYITNTYNTTFSLTASDQFY